MNAIWEILLSFIRGGHLDRFDCIYAKSKKVVTELTRQVKIHRICEKSQEIARNRTHKGINIMIIPTQFLTIHGIRSELLQQHKNKATPSVQHKLLENNLFMRAKKFS